MKIIIISILFISIEANACLGNEPSQEENFWMNFGTNDIDKDDKISKEEYQGELGDFDLRDWDDDGFISKEEVPVVNCIMGTPDDKE